MKHSWTRTWALLLCLFLLLGQIPAFAAADTEAPGPADGAAVRPEPAEGGVIALPEQIYVNPLYRDIVSEAEIAALPRTPANPADVPLSDYTVTTAEAGVSLREQMKARQEDAVVYLMLDHVITDEDWDAIKRSAMAHTGEPDEGDYLLYQFGGYHAGGNISLIGEAYYHTLEYSVSYYTTAAQEQAVDEMLPGVMESLGLSGKSDSEKIRAVYDWLCQTVEYDREHGSDYKLRTTAYAALINHSAVCQGYSVLFYRMLLEAGVDCRVITGFGGSETDPDRPSNHAWNIARPGPAGTLYYNLDATWGATWYSASPGLEDVWFLRGETDFTDQGNIHVRVFDEEYDLWDYTAPAFYAAYPMGETYWTPSAALTITSHPRDASGPVGSTVSFHVEAEGTGLQYQWQYKTPTGSWKNSSSATAGYNTDTLQVAVTQTRNGYRYRCVVSNAAGTSAASNAAVLTVSAALTITSHPQDASGPVGSTVSFHVEAEGTGLQYRWQYKTPTGRWKNSSSATAGCNTDTLQVVVTQTRNGYRYRCIVTDGGGNTATSDAAALTVSAALTITSHPRDASGPVGSTVSFHVEAEGTGLQYRWQYKTPTGVWKNSSSATAGYNTDTLQVVVTQTRNGYQYRCVVTDGGGNTAASDAAALTVSAAPAITAHPRDVYAVGGTTAVFTVAANGSGLTYRWQYKVPGGTWKDCTSATVGYHADTLEVAAAAKRNNYEYRCVVTDGNGNTAASDAAVLTVFALTKNPSAASGPVGSSVTFSVAAVGAGLQYQWQYKVPGREWKNCSSATAGYQSDTLTVAVTTGRNGYQYRCVVTDSAGNTLTSAAAKLSVS